MKINRQTRNLYHYMHKLFYDPDFVCDLRALLEKWDSPYLAEPLSYYFEYTEPNELNAVIQRAEIQRSAFLEQLETEGRYLEFLSDVKSLIERFDFGMEWKTCFMDLIISEWMFPPAIAFYIQRTGEAGKERIILTLNPDTEREDIIKAWRVIQNAKKRARPLHNNRYITMKSLGDLFIIIKDKINRDKDFKRKDSVTTTNYKIFDIDRVGQYWKDEMDLSATADKKRVAKLRTKRLRVSRKLK